ncbi:hypothetical protein RRG08_001107 [Elysia crispata]|uniref:Uncharacterized protein n=1 Tax=Elysia crispata TaxID=231223 RepID=A0AAE1AX54_9GAST|nr:hypothetical protein RRG08_001107 [Elysia crispata]
MFLRYRFHKVVGSRSKSLLTEYIRFETKLSWWHLVQGTEGLIKARYECLACWAQVSAITAPKLQVVITAPRITHATGWVGSNSNTELTGKSQDLRKRRKMWEPPGPRYGSGHLESRAQQPSLDSPRVRYRGITRAGLADIRIIIITVMLDYSIVPDNLDLLLLRVCGGARNTIMMTFVRSTVNMFHELSMLEKQKHPPPVGPMNGSTSLTTGWLLVNIDVTITNAL